jgi:hypothetical protein
MVWESEQYWKKAIRYVELAYEPEREPWEKPFWLSLALEFLARAALTKIHPALNADPQEDGLNLLYAFGYELKGQPKSLPIHAVLLRLQKILPNSFSRPHREFCDFFANTRNQELHTTELPFESLTELKWLARFYDVCLVLCEHLGKEPQELLGDDQIKTAKDLVKALKSEKVGTVKKKIAAHATVFAEKVAEEKAQAIAHTKGISWQWLKTSTRAPCPACGNDARLQGHVERISRPFYDGEGLKQEITVLADKLDCPVCNLNLSDIEELHIAELEPHFRYYEETELHEYHEYDHAQEYDNM